MLCVLCIYVFYNFYTFFNLELSNWFITFLVVLFPNKDLFYFQYLKNIYQLFF